MKQLTTHLKQNDLVYAKIQNFPWWPGKIIQTFQQKNTLIFKIKFYADPTYSYLEKHNLIAYEDFEQKLNSTYQIDSCLRKAIDLASKVNQRKKAKSILENSPVSKQLLTSSKDLTIETQMIEEEEKVEQFQQSTIHVDSYSQNQNIKKYAQSSNSKTQKQKTNLINLLLAKYSLDKIPKPLNSDQKQQSSKFYKEFKSQILESHDVQQLQLYNIKNNPRRRKLLKKNSKKFLIKKMKINTATSQQRRVQFIRRFCSMLIKKGLDSSVSRQLTLKVAQKIEKTIFTDKNLQKKQLIKEEFYLQIVNSFSNKTFCFFDQQKQLQVQNLVQSIIQRISGTKKQEEEKTNLEFAAEESLEFQ